MGVAFALGLLATPAVAQSPRELLAEAAYQDRDRAAAFAKVQRARSLAAAAAARAPGEQEPAVIAAAAQGYLAKLTGDRKEAVAAKREFEALLRRFPRNPEAQIGIGAWHLSVINRAGRLIGRVIGAQRSVGIRSLERAVALGGNRAMFAGLAGMMLVELDPSDARARAWIEQAARAPTPTPLDRTIQRSVLQVAAALRRGDRKAAQTLADRLAPFGWYKRD